MDGEEGQGDSVKCGHSFSLGRWKILKVDDVWKSHNNVNLLNSIEVYS